MNGYLSYDAGVWPALIAFIIVITLGLYAWRRRHMLPARPFTIACLFGALWTFGTMMEISSVGFSDKVFWLKFQVAWQLPTASAIFCFILAFAGLGRLLNRRNIILVSMVPLLVIVVIITNDLHHLLWTGFQMDGHVDSSAGKLYWIFIGYVYAIGLANAALLVWLALRSPRYRWPVAIIILCQIIVRIGYTMDKLDIGTIGPGEIVLFNIGIVSLAYAIVFFRYHAIDPVPAARTAVIQQMREGIFIIDLEGRIIDVNPAVAAIVGTPRVSLRGKPLSEVMPAVTSVAEDLESGETGQTEITLGEGISARQYTLNVTSLRDRHGDVIGKLLLLHDITGRKQAQKRIIEQQSIVATLQERERLARELHDSIGQVIGYVGIQAQTARKYVNDGNNEKADSLLERLVEVAKDTHADVRESILNLRIASPQDWSFLPALKNYLDNFQKNYGIHIELIHSDGTAEDTFDSSAGVHLLRVIQEALTNARKHSDAHNVKVSLNRVGNVMHITLTDDGRGFDYGQFEEDNDNHFGLAFMRERMAHVGGSLEIDSKAGEGTTVKIVVPFRESLEEPR